MARRTPQDKLDMMYIISGVSRDTSEIGRGVYRDDSKQIAINIAQITKKLNKLAEFFDPDELIQANNNLQ